MGSQDTKNSREQIEDKRKTICKDFSFMAVEYTLHPDTTYEIFLGFTDSCSGSSWCLFTPKLLKQGQEIIFRSNLPAVSQKAVVCWVEKYDSVYYKVGLDSIK